MPLADVNGITINYVFHEPPNSTSTDAPLLVLINGLADDLTTWSFQLPSFLSAGYRILTYDNRGVGLSSKPPGPYTADLLASDLHGLLKYLEVRTAHFLGVSMGGMILQSYALNYPNDSAAQDGYGAMESVILACTYAAPGEFCSRLWGLWKDMAVQMGVRDVMRDVVCWAFTSGFFDRRPDEAREVERGLEGCEMRVGEYLSQLEVIRGFDSRGTLEAVRGDGRAFGVLEMGRVLVLAAEEDHLIPVRLSRELKERIEGSVWKTVKGGHACMWEYPHSFNEAVLDFLNGCKS